MLHLNLKGNNLIFGLGIVSVVCLGLAVKPAIVQCLLKNHSEYLFQSGLNAYKNGDLLQAERFWRSSLSEQELDSSLKFQTSESANNLGFTLSMMGKVGESELLLKKAVSIRRGCRNDGRLSTSLHILGRLYLRQGRLSEAEPLLKESLAIRTRVYGAEDSDTLASKQLLAQINKMRQPES